MTTVVEDLRRDEALRLLVDARTATRGVADAQRRILAAGDVDDDGLEQAVALLFLAEERESGLVRALLRLAKGDYGRCDVCGGPIDAGRLRRRPDARWCTQHQVPPAGASRA